MDSRCPTSLLAFLILNVGISTAAPVANPQATSKHGVSYRISSLVTNCTLSATDEETADTVTDHIESGAKLIKFTIQLPESEKAFKNDNSSLMYKPLSWVRTPGRLGNGLLLLRPEYDILSLGTLELGVVKMRIQVEASPAGCLSQLSDIDSEKLLRALVLNHFGNSSMQGSTAGKPNDQVCNMHATDDDGTARFDYFCCRTNGPTHIHCHYLEKDTWLEVLFAVMTFLKILVILFSPRFVPDSLYRIRHKPKIYRHKFLDGKSVTLTTAITRTPKHLEGRTVAKLNSSKFDDMTGFQTCLDKLRQNMDKAHRLVLRELRFTASSGRLLGPSSAPVSIFNTVYEAFVKCNINERESLNECCRTNMLKKCTCCECSCTFLRFCKELMKFMLVLLLAVPWVLRALAYYEFEHDEMELRKKAADNRGLTMELPANMTLFLTPLHIMFIVIYVILSVEMCICGTAARLGTKVSETLKFATRKCFRDMREMNNTDIVGWAVKLSLKPCSSFGLPGIVMGIILWPLLLPIIFIVWAFYMFPTINITIRLFIDLCSYLLSCVRRRNNGSNNQPNDENDNTIYQKLNLDQLKAPTSTLEEIKSEGKNISTCVQPLIILLSLVTCYSIIFLLVELVSFVVEIVVYTLMGLILNAGTIMTYISLGILLTVYGNEVFGYVTTTFLAFNKKMNQIVLGLGIEKVEGVIYTREDKQDNVSFRVKTDMCAVLENPVEFTVCLEGKPSWSVKRMLLFLDRQDQPLIPKQFYFNACKMDYFAAPGELLFRYIGAAIEFGLILIFLLFVLLVVLAFGDSYEISSTNRLFATTLGGFVPLLLRKVVFKSHAVPEIDQSSVHFQVSLTELIEEYHEVWPIYDIHVAPEGVAVLEDYGGDLDLVIVDGILLFVLLVVLAFGDSYEISSTNRLFATTLGGFVPLLLRKVVLKSHAVPEIDQSSVHFQVSLTELIEEYHEVWPIYDIHVAPEGVAVMEDYGGDIDLVIVDG